MSKPKWLNNIARLIKYEKNGKPGYFLLFERRKDKDGKFVGESPYPLTINEGDTLQAKLKTEDLKNLVAEGFLTQEAADDICKHTKFEFSKAPPREDDQAKDQKSGTAANPKKKPSNDEDVF